MASSKSFPVYGGRLRPLSGPPAVSDRCGAVGPAVIPPTDGRGEFAYSAALATSTETPGPMVELSEIFLR